MAPSMAFKNIRWAQPLLSLLATLSVRMLCSKTGVATLAILSLYLGARGCGSGAPLRVGTFNVREFGPSTDLGRLTALLAESDADVMAVQEIQRPDLLPQVAKLLSAKSGRSYLSIASDCGGKRAMHVGFLFDAKRVKLDAVEEFPELRDDRGGSCSLGARAGLLGVFSQRSWFRHREYALLTVHFPAGGDVEQARERQLFWARALRIAARVRDGGRERVLILGDVNSTGYRENIYGERDSIHVAVKRAGFHLLTPDLRCTEYFQPPEHNAFLPSHLDHIVGSGAVSARGEPRVLSFCAALRCAPTGTMPSDFAAVSDHCPVLLDVN